MTTLELKWMLMVVLGSIWCLHDVHGNDLVSWYYHSRSYSRLCYCSIYLDSCYPNGCVSDGGCSIPLPKNYIAQHLHGKTIAIDGKLDDPAWEEVPWSASFDDIRGSTFPKPKLETKFKLRWDDNNLYVALYMKTKNMWATMTADESHLFRENAIDLFFVPDETLHNYKQIEGNVRNATFDLSLSKAYMDGGIANEAWEAREEKGVTHDGTINDPEDPGSFWTTEWALPFRSLSEGSTRNQSKPFDDEVHFMQFARMNQHLRVARGTYELDTPAQTDWWTWEPIGAVNLHLPSRWGLVKFSKDMKNKVFSFPRWHIYKTLFSIFDALQQYKAMNGIYSSKLDEIPVPRHVYRRRCIELPIIEVLGNGFVVTVKSRITGETGSIAQDRGVAFH
ncbi:uncharacterized protein LOC110450447 [Mizuhopecten yessoensis]|uniref:Carbohydrate-binding domain-containing protein n=1 Tax=Mizuhopecten yessoensis TaxID=6573 RepID=A0A210QNS7_MIZYE|nr:uncharacterized protein LOC110450447 [Mizuhopecten yessoensis]OWF50389.1 hypothetical protein KP79_PYT09458 [Mizuhopecten yessoensis]